MTEEQHAEPESVEGVGWMFLGVVCVAVICWIVPVTVVVLHVGAVPKLGLFAAVRSAGNLFAGDHWQDPASAYPPHIRGQMPTPIAWWGAVAWLVAVLASITVAAVRGLEPLVARWRLGRRPYDWRGARPRAWARPRDLRMPGSQGGGFSLGRLDGRPVYAEEEAHVALIAPTRAGKTTRCVIPWLLEHPGPAIVTSTKRDVLEATRSARERVGRIWVFDPFSDDSVGWSPVAGCDSWSTALRRSQWLANASAGGESEIARYWRGEAAKLLAPLLHAAALDGRGVMDLLEWVDTQDTKRPAVILASRSALAAEHQLQAVASLDSRNRGTTYMSAGSVLAAYRYPEVANQTRAELSPARILGSAADTLFLVAAERHQQLLAPLIVSIVSSMLHRAIESPHFSEDGRRLRVLLDEAANIAPLHELPRILSQAAGHGVRVATVWQSLAQMRERHNRGADTILANSTAKLFMGPITDEATRTYVTGLLGERREADDWRTARAGELQQLGTERSLLISGDRLPALVTLAPYWEDGRPWLRRR